MAFPASPLILLCCSTVVLRAQVARPRFEDFPVTSEWNGPNAPIKLISSSERMFRTLLGEASRKPPDFAGHYRFALWGCGSACAAGALIDLQTGIVFRPPRSGKQSGWDTWIFCGGFVDGPYVEYRVRSKLVLVRCQGNDPAAQDLSYFVWEDDHFRPILRLTQKKPAPVGSSRK